MPDINPYLKHPPSKEPLDIPTNTNTASRNPTDRRIKHTKRMPLDIIPQSEHRWYRVTKIKQARSCHDRGKVDVSRYSGCNDKRCNPPDRNNHSIDDLPTFRGQEGSVEDIDQNVVVEHLDTNIRIQSGSDQPTQKGQDIPSSLPSVVRNPEIRRVECILSLILRSLARAV